MITYEYPLSERVRTLLRLEDLFDKVTHFAAADGAMEHHVALVTLFEILEVAGRAELKFDLVQELERQRQILLSFRNNPEISEDALSGALYEIEQASALLLAMHGKIGHYLRENEWLMTIKNRAAIPGGVCEFDLPGYHYWRHRDSALRQQDIKGWLAPMMPTTLPANGGSGGRDIQSRVFLRTPGIEKLYSGVAMKMPRCASIMRRSFFAFSGAPSRDS